MSRSLVSLRRALPSDAHVLAELWGSVLRRADPEDQLADLLGIIEGAAASDSERLVVAEYDGEVAGAVHLRVSTLSPINLERIVQVVAPHVLPQYRRHGVGRALMDAAVSFAEELGIGCVGTAVAANRRDANRFMARLSFAPQAMLRAATTSAVRARLPQGRQVTQAAPHRQRIDRVLAARRVRRERVPG